MKDGQTIGQWLKWDFKINGDLDIRNKDNELIYTEQSNQSWAKWEYDSQGNRVYFEDSTGVWIKYEYDSQGNQIYFECSTGYWSKQEYDYKGNEIYLENSNGIIIDNRPKTCEGKVVEIEGVKYKLVKQ